MSEVSQLLEIVFIPSLLEMLTFNEKDKGSDLNEDEVWNLRDKSICMTINLEAFKKIEEERGYKDIDPENCWEDWCDYKKRNAV